LARFVKPVDAFQAVIEQRKILVHASNFEKSHEECRM